MTGPRAGSVSIRLALALFGSLGALALLCVVGLYSLNNLLSVTRHAVTQHIADINDINGLQVLLYQKGFVSTYMLTGDRYWLQQLDERRNTFTEALQRVRRGTNVEQDLRILEQLEREYAAFDQARRRIVTLFDAGYRDEARHLLVKMNKGGIEHLMELCQLFARAAQEQASATLALAVRSTYHLSWLLLFTSILGALATLSLGFLWARRVSAALLEQRQRLHQSEKLSAIGELAAKMAHELLNPLAGMKTAAQLIVKKSLSEELDPVFVRENGEALNQEIVRVERLVRRLVDYARPLAPRIEVCDVAQLLDSAIESARLEIARAGVVLVRLEEPLLPPLEVDPLLISQALANLVVNAAHASPRGGRVELRVTRQRKGKKDWIRIQVQDEGPGIARDHLRRLFLPFFTTKAHGNGLGLAVSHNIVVEHDGLISARNREDRPGAVFEVWLPLLR